ncbi:MAG: LTA synthase family protein, partial [Planctomycetaceae bacterium]|nr:LTA synthase family protein [Planctomycetaceae bacterium]
NPDATDVTFPHNTNISTWKQYQISYSKLFEFSEKQNVILIVSDAFANYLFLNQLEEHPEFKEQFKDFTFFTNMMTYGHTSYSIPQMLTGCDVDKIPPITDSLKYDRFLHETFNQPQSLLKSLATDGYRIDATFHTPGVLYCNSDWISNLKPIPHDKKSLLDKINDSGFLDVCYFTSLRVLPIFLKPLITSYIDRESQKTHEQSEHYEKLPLLRFDYSFANDLREYPVHISNENKTFKFYFLRGLHFPGEFNEKFNFEKIPPTQEERRAYAQLLLFQEIIRQLKEKGCYDNSLIIYTADHGLWCGKDAVSVIDPVHSVRPLLLIKKINETHKEMVVDQTYCSTQDITPTILSELSLPFTATNNSCSVFNMTEEMQIYRKAIFNDVTKWGYVHPQPSKTATGILLNNVKLTQVSDKIKSDYKKTALSRSRIKPSGDNFQISIGNEIKSWRDSPPKSVQIVLQSSSSGDNNNYTGNAVIINKPKFVACWTCTAEIDVSTLKTGEYDISYILSYRGNSYRYYSAGQKVTIDNNKVVNIYNPIQK